MIIINTDRYRNEETGALCFSEHHDEVYSTVREQMGKTIIVCGFSFIKQLLHSRVHMRIFCILIKP